MCILEIDPSKEACITLEKNFETVHIRDEVFKCEDIRELQDTISSKMQTRKEQWKIKINDVITLSGLTKSKFAQLCGVSRVAVSKWCNGAVPRNRETFLQIGMIAGYERGEMDHFLQRYGQYPALYAKQLEDCVCIFVLDHVEPEKRIEQYHYILNRIKENIGNAKENFGEKLETKTLNQKLAHVGNQSELEQFITEHVTAFSTTYHKFYACVKMNIMANYQDFGGSVFELAEGQGWSSSLRQCVSAIRQNKWYPTRNKIISLGLHLCMDREQIDEMLTLAYMEPLCAKNIFESVIIFILEDASLNNILDTQSEEFDPDGLCKYARKVLEEVDLEEGEAFLSELSEMDHEEW